MESVSVWKTQFNIKNSLSLEQTLKTKLIPEKQYQKWASSHYHIPVLKPEYFRTCSIDMKLWDKVKNQAQWNSSLIPLFEWEGALYIACLEPQKISTNQKVVFLLADIQQMEIFWNQFQKNSLPDIEKPHPCFQKSLKEKNIHSTFSNKKLEEDKKELSLSFVKEETEDSQRSIKQPSHQEKKDEPQSQEDHKPSEGPKTLKLKVEKQSIQMKTIQQPLQDSDLSLHKAYSEKHINEKNEDDFYLEKESFPLDEIKEKTNTLTRKFLNIILDNKKPSAKYNTKKKTNASAVHNIKKKTTISPPLHSQKMKSLQLKTKQKTSHQDLSKEHLNKTVESAVDKKYKGFSGSTKEGHNKEGEVKSLKHQPSTVEKKMNSNSSGYCEKNLKTPTPDSAVASKNVLKEAANLKNPSQKLVSGLEEKINKPHNCDKDESPPAEEKMLNRGSKKASHPVKEIRSNSLQKPSKNEESEEFEGLSHTAILSSKNMMSYYNKRFMEAPVPKKKVNLLNKLFSKPVTTGVNTKVQKVLEENSKLHFHKNKGRSSSPIRKILESTLTYIDSYILFTYKNNEFTPCKWSYHLTPSNKSSVSTVQPSLFRICRKSKQPYFGYLPPIAGNMNFFNQWGFQSLPQHAILIPFFDEHHTLLGGFLGISEGAEIPFHRLAVIDKMIQPLFNFYKNSKAY